MKFKDVLWIGLMEMVKVLRNSWNQIFFFMEMFIAYDALSDSYPYSRGLRDLLKPYLPVHSMEDKGEEISSLHDD